jgi:hypothetical protein
VQVLDHGRLDNDLIPTFRASELLSEAVESCIRQDHCPLEVPIGDEAGGGCGILWRSLARESNHREGGLNAEYKCIDLYVP